MQTGNKVDDTYQAAVSSDSITLGSRLHRVDCFYEFKPSKHRRKTSPSVDRYHDQMTWNKQHESTHRQKVLQANQTKATKKRYEPRELDGPAQGDPGKQRQGSEEN